MFVKSYIISAQSKSKRQIAIELGLNYDTMYSWWKGQAFRDWIAIAKVAFAGKIGVPLTWEKIATDAVAGNDKAQHKLLLRFDPIYRAAYNKQPIEERREDPRIGGDSEAARRALLQTGVGTRRKREPRQVELEGDGGPGEE